MVNAACSCSAGILGPIHMSFVITMPPSSSVLPFWRMAIVITTFWQS